MRSPALNALNLFVFSIDLYMDIRQLPGTANELGATWDGRGTNFALFSENATKVELCLFTKRGKESRYALKEVYNFVWHGYFRK